LRNVDFLLHQIGLHFQLKKIVEAVLQSLLSCATEIAL